MPSHVGRHVDIMVSPALQEDVKRKLNGASIHFEVMIKNVQPWIEKESKEMDSNEFDYNKYNRYKEVILFQFFHGLISQNKSKLASLYLWFYSCS